MSENYLNNVQLVQLLLQQDGSWLNIYRIHIIPIKSKNQNFNPVQNEPNSYLIIILFLINPATKFFYLKKIQVLFFQTINHYYSIPTLGPQLGFPFIQFLLSHAVLHTWVTRANKDTYFNFQDRIRHQKHIVQMNIPLSD